MWTCQLIFVDFTMGWNKCIELVPVVDVLYSFIPFFTPRCRRTTPSLDIIRNSFSVPRCYRSTIFSIQFCMLRFSVKYDNRFLFRSCNCVEHFVLAPLTKDIPIHLRIIVRLIRFGTPIRMYQQKQHEINLNVYQKQTVFGRVFSSIANGVFPFLLACKVLADPCFILVENVESFVTIHLNAL